MSSGRHKDEESQYSRSHVTPPCLVTRGSGWLNNKY